MQKKLIALAIAGLSSAAFAQSNVTIYGVVDGSFENISATGATANGVGVANTSMNLNSRSRIVSNSSYLGFKGSESLGNGLTAQFQIETQFAVDNAAGGGTNGTAGFGGTNTLGNRDTFAALQGGFGTAKLGFITTPHRALQTGFDVVPGSAGVANGNNLIGKINVGASLSAVGTTTNTVASGANTIYRTQGLMYTSPNFSGFNGSLLYVPNETRTSLANNAAAGTAAPNPSSWNLGLNYANGPIKAAYSYLTTKDVLGAANANFVAGAALSSSKLKSHLIGVGYTLGGATTVNFIWNSNKIDASSIPVAAGMSNIKNAVWSLGLKHSIGANDFAVQYQRANDGSVSNAGAGTANSADRGANAIGLRYGYNFSKRTQIYGVYSRISNKSNGNYDFGGATAASGTGGNAALSAGADPTALGVGIRHSF